MNNIYKPTSLCILRLIINQMVDPLIYQELNKVFKNISSAVERNSDETVSAEEVISELTNDGGGIEVIGDDFSPQYENIMDIKERVSDKYNYACGLDGSTTRDLTYNNGLILGASTAGVAIANREKVDEKNSRGTVSVFAYFDDSDLDIEQEYESKNNTQVYVKQYPRAKYLHSDLSKWVADLSRSYAEGKHFEWYSNSRDNEPFFVDGPLIPADILTWCLYDQEGIERRSPVNDWPDMIEEILQSYINGIENCIKQKTPLFGVQKTTTATRVLDALREKSDLSRADIRWQNDADLFNDALKPDRKNGNVIAYTPWYVENDIILNDSKRVVPLQNYDKVTLSHGSAEEYVRAFFYAKPPNKKTVYRIGVPQMLFDRGLEPDTLRDIALNEMNFQFSEPLPIVLADEKVRIDRNIRSKLENIIKSEIHNNHNEQRGYKGD